MTEPQESGAPEQVGEHALDDTKEAMRKALDAKKAAQRQGTDAGQGRKKSIGGPHGKEGGSRQFRRKSG